MGQQLFEFNLSISSGDWGELGGPELFLCLQVSTISSMLKSSSRLLVISRREGMISEGEGAQAPLWVQREHPLTPPEGEQLSRLIEALGLEKDQLAIEPIVDTSEGWVRLSCSVNDLLSGEIHTHQVFTESSGVRGADAPAFRRLIYALFAKLGDDDARALMRRFQL